jgi:mono/diheme cytochrome c family protein
VWDGVYASAQAARGAAQYAEACSSCHAADLRGNSNAPSLVGVSFLFVWEDRSLEELFTTVRTRMPTNAPNSLPVQSYVDIVAYVLAANAFPAGAAELRADPAFLARIAITASAAP